MTFESIQFPQSLVESQNEKVTIYTKVIQFHNPKNDHNPHFFELVSEAIKLNDHNNFSVDPEL